MESFRTRHLQGLATAALLSSAERVSSDDSDERWALVHELQRRGGAETFRAASGWCLAAEAHLRRLGADVLGQLGYPDSHPFADDSTPILVDLLRDREVEVVTDALIALGHLARGEVGLIADLASHTDARVRYGVAVCLGSRANDAATRTLLTLSKDHDRDVRDWATFCLADMIHADTPEIRAALTERLDDIDDEIRGEAMVGLANRGVTDVIPAIVNELRATSSVLAVRAASIIRDPLFVPELTQLLAINPADRDVREALDRCSTH